MVGNILTLVGYSRAPKTTFVFRHPIQSIRAMRARRRLKNFVRGQRLALTVGAAVAALPFGIWMGSRMRRH